jgi:nucleotide-binding universal stress UspA family protein
MKTAEADSPELESAPPAAVFDRVVCGVDGTDASLHAARQAARLVSPSGWLEVFNAAYLFEADVNGRLARRVDAEVEARETISRAAAIAGSRAKSRLVDGPPLQSLVQELNEKHATLAVVGTHARRRLYEIVIGGVGGELLHNARCSVLIARQPLTDALFPHAIAAGADGSPESDRAVAVAEYLADRFGVPLRVITALQGKFVDPAGAPTAAPTEMFDEHPVRALVRASMDADILVVGSRGLHGLKSLGSVSERVAHQAACSVLVVRAGTQE